MRRDFPGSGKMILVQRLEKRRVDDAVVDVVVDCTAVLQRETHKTKSVIHRMREDRPHNKVIPGLTKSKANGVDYETSLTVIKVAKFRSMKLDPETLTPIGVSNELDWTTGAFENFTREREGWRVIELETAIELSAPIEKTILPVTVETPEEKITLPADWYGRKP